jgi:hypothetical protein
MGQRGLPRRQSTKRFFHTADVTSALWKGSWMKAMEPQQQEVILLGYRIGYRHRHLLCSVQNSASENFCSR